MTQQMQIRDLAAKGSTPTEIKEATGFSYPTIRKYLAKEDFSPKRPVKRTEESILDPYKPLIAKMFEEDRRIYHKQRHTAKRIHSRLADEHGFEGSYSTVQRYVKELKSQARLEAAKGPFLDLEWPAGTMQVDFGQADFDYRGNLTRMHYLAESFPQSNHGLAQLFGDEKAVRVCQGLKDTFEHIDGVPPLVVFDNATEVGRRVCGKVRESDPFKAFRMHYGFEAAFANPDSGHEKGNVEGKVGWIRRNLFVPVPKVGSLKAFNEGLLAQCDKCSEKEDHYQKQLSWAQLFEADRLALMPLPAVPFDAVDWVACKTDGYGKVTIGRTKDSPGHKYLADPSMPEAEVIVGVRAYEVEIGTLAGEHLRPTPAASAPASQTTRTRLPCSTCWCARPARSRCRACTRCLPSPCKDTSMPCGPRTCASSSRPWPGLLASMASRPARRPSRTRWRPPARPRRATSRSPRRASAARAAKPRTTARAS